MTAQYPNRISARSAPASSFIRKEGVHLQLHFAGQAAQLELANAHMEPVDKVLRGACSENCRRLAHIRRTTATTRPMIVSSSSAAE